MRNIADPNGAHRLVNPMTRFRLCRSSIRATVISQADFNLSPTTRRPGGSRRAVAIRDRTTGVHLLSAVLLFSAVLFFSAVLLFSAALFLSAVLRGSGGFRGPD
jgi:hypothetical protein